MKKNPYHYKWTDLTVEPSLVEPEPVQVGYNVQAPYLHRGENQIVNDQPFKTYEEAVDFALQHFGVTIKIVKPIDKRGLHFE
jgi:hypothetical protein